MKNMKLFLKISVLFVLFGLVPFVSHAQGGGAGSCGDTILTNPQTSQPFSFCCNGAASDDDGDGWGYEAGSCIVKGSNKHVCGETQNGKPYCCGVNPTDDNNDGWGDEEGLSCIIKGGKADPNVNSGGSGSNTVSTPTASPNSSKLINPLAKGGVEDIPTLVEKILNIALKIGAPIIALAIIYAGYLFIAAQGNATKLETAKKTLVYVVIGAAILLGAYVIAESIVGTVNSIRGQ